MKIDRLISIIMVLLNCEKMSATKLAAMFEVSPRTIYRDIEVIEKTGIPIFTMKLMKLTQTSHIIIEQNHRKSDVANIKIA